MLSLVHRDFQGCRQRNSAKTKQQLRKNGINPDWEEADGSCTTITLLPYCPILTRTARARPDRVA